MMRNIITVTEFASMPGRYQYTVQRDGKLVVSKQHAGNDTQAAAAQAVCSALRSTGSYVILGPKKVLAEIPVEIRIRV